MRYARMTMCLAWTMMACGTSTPDVPKDQPPAVVLNAPWSAMSLPVGAGNVKAESGNELHVIYADSSISRDEAGSTWGDALEKDGWQEVNIQAMGPMVAIDYTKGDAALQFIVAASGKRVDVTLELK